MSFFIKEENVRAGNRGGRSLFNWNDIRVLNNKERESYLGVTQSIGFLDKGGKWRKRDWWQDKKKQNLEIDKNEILMEKERIKLDEEKLYKEQFSALYGNTVNPKSNNQKKEKLTVFEWKELMKKENNLNPNDPKIFEFYENDEHKRGLGMKANISFRTNPYEKDILQNLKKIEGEGIDSLEKEEDFEKNKNNSENIEENISENNFENVDNHHTHKEKKEQRNKDDKRKKVEKLLMKYFGEGVLSSHKENIDHLLEVWEKEQMNNKFGSLEDLEKKSEKKNKKKKKSKKSKKSKRKISEDSRSSSSTVDRKKIDRSRSRKRSISKSRKRSVSMSRSMSNSRRRYKK